MRLIALAAQSSKKVSICEPTRRKRASPRSPKEGRCSSARSSVPIIKLAYVAEFEFRFNNRKNPHLFRETLKRLLSAEPLPFEKLTAKNEAA
jgi:hypothetical protein